MKNEYFKYIENDDLDKLSNIKRIFDLVQIKYYDKFLIEYLLEKDVHTKEMDEKARYNNKFMWFYLKYNIINPLISSSLVPLLNKYDRDNYYLDILLDKLNNEEKKELYHNIKVKSYNLYHDREREVLDIFFRHGVVISSIFVISNRENKKYVVNDSDEKVICKLSKCLNFENNLIKEMILNEFRRCLLENHDRTILDINKLIDYQKDNPDFIIKDSENNDGLYDKKTKTLETGYIPLVFIHEFSHLLYQNYEQKDVFDEYELLREQIDNKDTIKKIEDYLTLFHSEYDDYKEFFEKKYYEIVNKKYDSFDNYIKKVCEDMLANKPELLTIWNEEAGYTDLYEVEEDTVKDIVMEFLEIEKREYITYNVRKLFASKLMLENLLDALLLGKIADENLNVKCLSGHSESYFIKNEFLSFDECLANYDTIKKSEDKTDILEDLEMLIGEDLIKFLDNYIEKNRENNYGFR